MARRLIFFASVFILIWLTLSRIPLWWASALLILIICILLPDSFTKKAFLIGGLAGGLAWMLFSIKTDFANNQILSPKIAELFHLPSSSFLWLIELLLGFITIGLSAWAGKALKQHFFHKGEVHTQ